MVKIIERSNRRLKVRCDGQAITSSICTLDVDRNTAEFSSRVFQVPYRNTRVALSSVANVVVQRRSRRKDYRAICELRAGPSISLGSYTKEEALEIAKAIRDFLRESQEALSTRSP